MATRLPSDHLHRHMCDVCGQVDEARLQACPSCSERYQRKKERAEALASIRKSKLIQQINTLVNELADR